VGSPVRRSLPSGHALTASMDQAVVQDRSAASVASKRVLDAAVPTGARVSFPLEPALGSQRVQLVGRAGTPPPKVNRPAPKAAAGAVVPGGNFKALKEANVRTDGETRKAYRARLMEKLKAKKVQMGLG
jgi:hypothetical protein